MKVLLFSLLSTIAGIAIYAENPVGYSYTPLVREGVEWGYKWTYYPLKEGSYYLQLSGDTLINSKTYKVCYRYATVDFQKEDAMVYGFVREEGKRIYAIGRRVPNKSRQPGTAPVGRQSLLQRLQSRQAHRIACRHVGAHCRSRHYGRRDDCNKRGATARGHLYCDAEVGQGIDFKRENPRKPPLNAAAESLRRLDDSNHISTVVSTVVSGVGLTNMSTGGCCVSSSASHVSATSFIRRS